ncbi:MAG: tetratricopeptide repeat protein [Candidatus Abyssobacteria bacterium SURF_17]|uniref:Tetratricopeptide repeat protein n=1 Tax=Candidatus Abyssobacteria bacterium SURF_17 TaxID=2093361 RepID=A0A419F021_9BACT|nr:MAG: tetratricopeptide repeat protein [Candidatus Abyssubacteria bacterium SURF_17]
MNTTTGSARLGPSGLYSFLKWIPVVALIILGLSLFSNTIIDTDIWWHLSAGRYIFQTHTIPHADIFTYPSAGHEWIDLHWLFQVILYGVHSAWGSYGISILFILIFSATFLTLWGACRPVKYRLAAFLLFWLALMACSSRFLPRPEAFTYLMISLYVLLLHGFERGHCKQAVFLLVPLQVVWTNMQGLFILGPFLIFAFLFPMVVMPFGARVLKREWSRPQPDSVKRLAAVFLGSIVACLINPYGIQGFLFPFTLFTRAGGLENMFARSIAELQPPFSGYNLTTPLKYFGVFLALSAAALVLDFKNLKVSHIIIFAGTAYLALNARRNVPIFVIAFLPLAVFHAGNLLERVEQGWNGKFRSVMKAIGVACAILLALVSAFYAFSVLTNRYYISDKRAERFGFGFKEQMFPNGSFVFLKEKEVRGPLFNNVDIGGFFIWKMYPDEKAFIDARLEANSAEVFAEYFQAMSDPQAFEALSQKYGFNAIVLSHGSGDALFLMPDLYSSPRWTLVYLDPLAAVFARNRPENATLIAENRVNVALNHIPFLSPNDTLNASSSKMLQGILDTVAAVPPSDAEAQNRFALGLLLLVMGQPERAIAYFKAGLELMPSSPEGHYNLGLAYDRMGQTEMAVESYRKSLELDTEHTFAHVNLGRIYDERGLKKEAEKEYRLAIKYGGEMPVPLFNLGALSYEGGDRDAARNYWQRALKADPSFTPAREALNQLESPSPSSH